MASQVGNRWPARQGAVPNGLPARLFTPLLLFLLFAPVFFSYLLILFPSFYLPQSLRQP